MYNKLKLYFTNGDVMIRKHITFYGSVQGVGFRLRAQHAANTLGITGWVRNEYDGSVTMVVQGDEVQIERMIKTLYNDMYIDICAMDEKLLTTDENERSFYVKY